MLHLNTALITFDKLNSMFHSVYTNTNAPLQVSGGQLVKHNAAEQQCAIPLIGAKLGEAVALRVQVHSCNLPREVRASHGHARIVRQARAGGMACVFCKGVIM